MTSFDWDSMTPIHTRPTTYQPIEPSILFGACPILGTQIEAGRRQLGALELLNVALPGLRSTAIALIDERVAPDTFIDWAQREGLLPDL